MQFQVKNRITIVTFSAALPIAVFLLDRIAYIDSRILKICAMALVVLIFGSALLLASSYSPKVKVNEKSAGDRKTENGTLGVLIPVEDESDLGELIEVSEEPDDIEPIIPRDTNEKIKEVRLAKSDGTDNEVLEELESVEEPVEELESLDE